MQKGYTLIELTIVMGIIGILLTLAIPAINSFFAPQELKSASQQLKIDLRTLQNKAANGITQKRFIDADGNGSVDSSSTDVRVYWVARFYNNQNYYQTTACQKNEPATRLGTASESWSACTNTSTGSEVTTVRFSDKIRFASCADTCSDYAVYFTPIYANAEFYTTTTYNTTAPVTSSALEGPLTISITSQSSTDKQVSLTINKDGSLTESCRTAGSNAPCN